MFRRYDLSMVDESLWTPANSEAVQRCRAALDAHDLASALLAIEDTEESLKTQVLVMLEHWAGLVRELLESSTTMTETDALRLVLVEQQELMGDGEAFYDPRNCYLSDVLSRRSGMPILLSSIWLIVARLAGIRAEGIGMPGHFIIRIGEDEDGLIDPFGGGRPLNIHRCAVIVKRLSGLEWDTDFLQPVSDEAIAARVVRNLQLCHHRNKQRVPLYRMARFNALLLPECPAAQLLHGQVAEMIDLEPLAIPIYRSVVSRYPKSREARMAKERIEELECEAPELH